MNKYLLLTSITQYTQLITLYLSLPISVTVSISTVSVFIFLTLTPNIANPFVV